jgi:hypothetical protein
MDVDGFVWIYMKVYGCAWIWMAVSGDDEGLDGRELTWVGVDGRAWTRMDNDGSGGMWTILGGSGCNSMDVSGDSEMDGCGLNRTLTRLGPVGIRLWKQRISVHPFYLHTERAR